MISVSQSGTRPIHEQIKSQIENQILSGVLEKDSTLPSVRELACSLAINPNTVQKAYFALESEGVTCSVNGKGRFVAVSADELKTRKAADELEILRGVVKKLSEYGFTIEDTIGYIKNSCKEEEK